MASKRILIVEHQANNLEPISRLLRLHGFQVATATCVREGRKLADAQAFDVVVSDVDLPDGSGRELLHEVRARRPVAGIAVVNPIENEQSAAQSQTDGFETCLEKPLLFAELVSAIGKLVQSNKT